MKTNEILANVTVASPCSARWGHMIGDERVRLCLQCQKHVYNFSAMTQGEIAQVVREKEGRLCARFYRRADGTILTADCPLGARRLWRQARTRLFASAALLAVAAGAAVASGSSEPQAVKAPRVNKLTVLWDDAKAQVKSWFGIKPQNRFVMGEICVIPPRYHEHENEHCELIHYQRRLSRRAARGGRRFDGRRHAVAPRKASSSHDCGVRSVPSYSGLLSAFSSRFNSSATSSLTRCFAMWTCLTGIPSRSATFFASNSFAMQRS
jgi:hypothetical protein